MVLGPPLVWSEALGDPVTNFGGTPVPATRVGLRPTVTLATFAPDGASDTLASRLVIRRALRSMMNNGPMKFAGGYYLIYSDDPDQNGWYLPDTSMVTDLDGSSGLATGAWKNDSVTWYLAGHPRTHREARNVTVKDLRLGTWARDVLGFVIGTDFSALNTLTRLSLPPGVRGVVDTVSHMRALLYPQAVGNDGGACSAVVGTSTLACMSFERADSVRGQGDVICYDRRGNLSKFYDDTVVADAPVSYWRLDETAGTVAADQIAANPGTYSGGFTLNQPGALTGSGDADASVTLNGTSGFVSIGNPTSLQFPGAFTVECWFKPATTAATQYILQKVTSTTGYYLSQAAGGAVSFGCGASVVTSVANYTSGWHHIVGTWDGTTQTLTVDGVPRTATPVGPTTLNTTASFQLGSLAGASFYPGSLDEAAVYNYALTAAQIQGHYNAGTTYDSGSDPRIDNGWEEAYGIDFQWNWAANAALADCPVLANGLCRVRWDASNTPGFKMEAWNGTAWAEQGKVVIQRNGDTNGLDDTWVSASLREYSFERAVVAVTLERAADPWSDERVYITMVRGVMGARFEVYPAPISAGTNADVRIQFDALPGDANDSAMVVDSVAIPPPANTAVNIATAGTGSTAFPTTVLGAGGFATAENYAAVLRSVTAFATVGPLQTTMAVVQSGTMAPVLGTSTAGYGTTTNQIAALTTSEPGYGSAQFTFSPTLADQVMEAESMTLGTNTTKGGDPLASGASTTQSGRTTDANLHVSRATWLTAQQGKYRVFARVKCISGTGNYYAKTTSTTGSTVTLAGAATPAYAWVDLGDIVADGTTLEIHAWGTGAGSKVEVDRIESYMLEDRTRTTPLWNASRDMAAAALQDTRVAQTVVSR